MRFDADWNDFFYFTKLHASNAFVVYNAKCKYFFSPDEDRCIIYRNVGTFLMCFMF